MDPYDHPITVHHSSTLDKTWTPFLGDSLFTVGAFQVNEVALVETWRAKSVAAEQPLVIGMDEYYPDTTSPENTNHHRREYLWPIYFSGGNVEFILSDLLRTDDFRKWDELWAYTAIARTFMETLPFWEMEPADGLLTGSSVFAGTNNQLPGQVFAKAGEIYAVYLPLAEATGALDLSGVEGGFVQRWFNPCSGKIEGDESMVTGGGAVALGPVPNKPKLDWVALVVRN